MNLSVNDGLMVVMVILSAATNAPLWCGMLVAEEALLVRVEHWVYGKSPFGECFHELKVTLKCPFYFKRKINAINENWKLNIKFIVRSTFQHPQRRCVKPGSFYPLNFYTIHRYRTEIEGNQRLSDLRESEYTQDFRCDVHSLLDIIHVFPCK